jgi:hypothetical protein
MRLGTLILSAAAAALALLTSEAQASFLARGPRACMVTGASQPRSDFARFMAVRGGMQVRPSCQSIRVSVYPSIDRGGAGPGLPVDSIGWKA